MYNVIHVGFQTLTAVTMKSFIFWDVTPCSPVEVHRCCGIRTASNFTLVTLIFASICSHWAPRQSHISHTARSPCFMFLLAAYLVYS
jgi:hypothetical protein